VERAREPVAPAPRWLVLRLGRGSYALHVDDVSGVAEPSRLRPVPLAPSGVLGLGQWRGRLLTVIDLPQVLGELPLDGPATLVRLAAPLEHTALLVPGPLRLVAADDDGRDRPRIDGRDHERLDPARVVAGLELAIGGREPSPGGGTTGG